MDFVNICRKALYFRGSLSICPAYAGVIPVEQVFNSCLPYLSRVCGGDPGNVSSFKEFREFVPRMRG